MREGKPLIAKQDAETHHSKAEKASPAAAVWHACHWVGQPLSPAARAMKPANQKIMVTDSTATMAKRWAATGRNMGARMR